MMMNDEMGNSSPDISSPILFAELKKLYDEHFVPRICIIELIASNKTKKYYLYLTVDGIIGTQCPSTYMASSIENSWEPSAISPLLCRLRLTQANVLPN